MPHVCRAAIVLAVVASATTASIPAWGQTGDRLSPTLPSDLTRGLGRPDRLPPPPFPEPQRGPPSPAPWAAVPAPRAGPSPGGIFTEQQAMNLFAAAGFTNVHLMQPNIDGTWTAYASKLGRTVRVTIDPQGNTSIR